MSSKFGLYNKANKVRTNLLLFVDREINKQKKKELIENKPIIIKGQKYKEYYIQFEETFSNNTKQEDITTTTSATTQMESCNNKLNKLKLIKPHAHPFSTNVTNILNIQVFDKKYGNNKFFAKRDSNICSTPIISNKKRMKNHEKYLQKIVKNLKKQKIHKKGRKEY